MKNIIIGIVVALLLIGGVVGATVLYDNLSEDYGNNKGGFVEFNPSGNNFTPNVPAGTTESINPSETTEKMDASVDETTTNKNDDVAEITTTNENSVEETTEIKEPAETDETVKKDETSEKTEPIVTESTTKNQETSEETEAVVTEETTKKEETTEKQEPELVFTAPDFTALDYEGNNVKLSDFAGKPIVLNFWGTWCPYCVQEMPVFNQAYKDFPDVQFLMLNCGDTVEKAKKYVESYGFDFEVIFDTSNQAQSIYGVYSFPTTFFITADGSKIYYMTGALDYETLVQGIDLIK